ncbi:MAG: hypothetical protein AB1599_01770 [Planctomycetota bacterium]
MENVVKGEMTSCICGCAAGAGEDNEQQPVSASSGSRTAKGKRNKWEKPALKDVSQEVMAQPYIRFT